MFKLLAVTNRKLCAGSLPEQLEIICSSEHKPDAVILREKDLTAAEYNQLAQEAAKICAAYHVQLILHSFWQTAMELDCKNIHLPLALLQTSEFQHYRNKFQLIGASIHSMEEAQQAAALGANYLTAGNIYVTSCKVGLAGRGLVWLSEICKEIKLPVYAIGGIYLSGEQFDDLQKSGASGACIMSEFMLLK